MEESASESVSLKRYFNRTSTAFLVIGIILIIPFTIFLVSYTAYKVSSINGIVTKNPIGFGISQQLGTGGAIALIWFMFFLWCIGVPSAAFGLWDLVKDSWQRENKLNVSKSSN